MGSDMELCFNVRTFFSTVYPFRSFLIPLGRTCTPSIAAALLMWKVVFPFIGWVLGGIFGGMSFSFTSIVDFFKSLF